MNNKYPLWYTREIIIIINLKIVYKQKYQNRNTNMRKLGKYLKSRLKLLVAITQVMQNGLS